ncbi:MAG: ABC transporter ATP-binding protein [Erysipelotrichaceae bacterium]|nr:ABC transporter ATP-binding protein [Erysipelotrichaceae bacterium]
MAFIELKNVSYKYPYTKDFALHDVNCSFEKGKFYGIIGENGGGKTTLCNLIRGLIPHFYLGKLTGECLIEGKDIRDWDTAELCSKIGYVFQNPFTQISGIKSTVFEEVAIGLENLGVPKDEMIERVIDVCNQLDIGHLIKNNPNMLSGGQRQRVAFASIIAMDTDTLVIDEPTSQLDPEGTENVFRIINTLKYSNKTIILVEHKIDLIAEFCDEILVMENGTIVFDGPTHEVLTNRELMDHRASIPEVARFGLAMEDAGKPLDKIPITMDEAYELIKKRG